MYSEKQKLAVVVNLCILAAILIYIFGHSMADRAASSAESQTVYRILDKFLRTVFGYEGLTEHIVRKIAHFCEFGALGFFSASLCFILRRSKEHYILHSLFFGMTTAMIDETIQMFNDRSAQVSDVWLDFSGAFCGIFVCLLIITLWIRRKKRRTKAKD